MLDGAEGHEAKAGEAVAEPARVAGVAVDRLRSFVERIENLEEDIRGFNADKAEVYKEAKDDGFDLGALKMVIRRRRKDHQELETEDYLVDLYERALGGEIAAPEPAGRNHAAYEAGYADGRSATRDQAAAWPSGKPGHGDYEIGWEDGHAALVDTESTVSRARAPARGRRKRIAEEWGEGAPA